MFLDYRLAHRPQTTVPQRTWTRQADILTDNVRQRHVGEGIRYIRYGLASERPTTETVSGALFFADDTGVLSIWSVTQGAWVDLTFT